MRHPCIVKDECSQTIMSRSDRKTFLYRYQEEDYSPNERCTRFVYKSVNEL